MDVLVCETPGRLVLEDRPKPVRTGNDVLLRVRRVGICGTDMHIFKGTQPFLSYPRVMGHELSAEVAEAPAGSALKTGDVVYVMPYLACGVCHACTRGRTNCCMNIKVLGVHTDGGMAEYITVPEPFVFKCDGIGLDEAAMIEFLAIGYHAVGRGDVQKGEHVLVAGVGPIGIAAALFARLRGAEVTVIDSRQSRLDFCTQHLGVHHAVMVGDGLRDKLSEITGGDFYDVVFDCTGNPAAMQAGFANVAHTGRYVLVSVVSADITFNDPEFHKRETTLLASRNATVADFEGVLEAMRAGHVPTAALNTHKAKLSELATVLPQWIDPEAGVIKAIVEC